MSSTLFHPDGLLISWTGLQSKNERAGVGLMAASATEAAMNVKGLLHFARSPAHGDGSGACGTEMHTSSWLKLAVVRFLSD